VRAALGARRLPQGKLARPQILVGATADPAAWWRLAEVT
jgi:hypothetical protein